MRRAYCNWRQPGLGSSPQGTGSTHSEAAPPTRQNALVAFFFKDDALTGVKVDVPNAQHRALGTVLLGQYGPPTIDGKGSNGLVGWKLPQGRMVYNRERDADPAVHNTVLWVSEAQAAAMGGL